MKRSHLLLILLMHARLGAEQRSHGVLGDVGERRNFGNGCFDLQRQIGNGALLSRLALGPGMILP